MKLLFTCLSLSVLVSFIAPVEAKTAQPAKAGANNVTGYYVNRYSNVSDSLKVLQLPNGKIKFELLALLLGSDSPHNGEVHGVASLKNGTVEYKGEDGCSVTMQFSANKVKVKVADADACGFGAFVTGDGEYKRRDKKVPKFDF